MATKKYVSLERLTEYDTLIKAEIAEGDDSVKSYVDIELAKKADKNHNHNDLYYTETEVDTLIDEIPEALFVINITGDDTNGYSADKTYDEFLEAYNSGRICVLRSDDGTISYHTGISSTYAAFATPASNVRSYMFVKSTNKVVVGNKNGKPYLLDNSNYNTIATTNKTIIGAINELNSSKADASHSHDDLYYTETEIDSKIDAINASIAGITSGSTKVQDAVHADSSTSADEATHAATADNATEANHAISADSATKATQDAAGNIITETYETKTDAAAKLNEAKEYADAAAAQKTMVQIITWGDDD